MKSAALCGRRLRSAASADAKNLRDFGRTIGPHLAGVGDRRPCDESHGLGERWRRKRIVARQGLVEWLTASPQKSTIWVGVAPSRASGDM